jgi:peptidoglycan/LPS O-acetylase OafA/YrhL
MNLSYLSRRNTDCLKGILALIVVIYHVSQKSEILTFLPETISSNLGYFPVTVFFFLSGYGLMASVNSKGTAYLGSFLRNRVVPFYVICVSLVVLYTGLNLVASPEEITPQLLLQSLTFGKDTIISKGWYLQVSLLIYVGFYLLFRYVSCEKKRWITAICSITVYCVLCEMLDFPLYYYQTVPAVLLGAVWYKYRIRLDLVIGDRRVMIALLAAEITGLCVAHYCTRIVFFARILMLACFVPLVLVFLRNVKIDCAATRFLGSISFEIYILHGPIPSLCRKLVSNDWVYAGTVILISLLLAVVAKPFTKKIYAAFRDTPSKHANETSITG